MSLLNVSVQSQSALIAADTIGITPSGDKYENTKICVLPHISAAISTRGASLFYATLCPAVQLISGDFDELVKHMPELLRYVFPETLKHATTLRVDPTWLTALDVALVGWSPREQRMTAWGYEQRDAAEGFRAFPIDGAWAAPWPPTSRVTAKDLATTEGMERLAKKQIAYMRESEPDRVTGGRLVVAQVRKGWATIGVKGHL